jgi:arginine/lysine/histidine transporter system substrate-binding protein
MKKFIAILVASLFLLVGITGCGQTEDKKAGTSPDNEKVLKVGTSADFPPFEYVDTAKSDEIIGFDIDLINHIAKKLGYTVQVQDMPFDSLITSVKNGTLDAALAGISINEERLKEVDFTDVYFHANNLLIVDKDSGIKKAEDLKGKNVGAQTGSVQATKGEELKETIDFTLEIRDRVQDLIQELKSGRLDAVILEEVASGGYLKKFPELEGNVISAEDETGFAIALQKGDSKKEEFNKILKEMKEDGTYDKLVEKWFNDDVASASMDISKIIPSMPYILGGIGVTLKIVALAIVLGLILGILLALCKISKYKLLVYVADFYTSIFRGTPLILQLMIIYFGAPQLFDYQIEAHVAAILAFGLNSAAYISEIFRAGILAVDKGQTEAAMALGIPYRKMMRNIILPQALKNILPALMNEFITLTKESAVVTAIGATDIMRRAYIVGADTFNYMEALLFAGLIYYVLVMILTLIGKLLERRLRHND